MGTDRILGTRLGTRKLIYTIKTRYQVQKKS